MFDELRAAFKEAIDNFNKELGRDQISESVDKLLIGMKGEIAEEKAHVVGLHDQLSRTSSEIERLTTDIETARRRETMASEIGDMETARLASEWTSRAEGQRAILARKAEALREEIDFRSRTVDEMFERFREAERQRHEMTASTGRSAARESIESANPLFEELDRMAEKIDDLDAQAQAVEAITDLDTEVPDSRGRVDLEAPAPHAEGDVDAALAELKRRMGQL